MNLISNLKNVSFLKARIFKKKKKKKKKKQL